MGIYSVLGIVSMFTLVTSNSHFYPPYKMSKIRIVSFMMKLKWGGVGIQTDFFSNNLIQFANAEEFWALKPK